MAPFNFKAQAKFSASHATLDPDRACSAAQDGTLSLSKAAIRLTQMMKAGHTFFTSAASPPTSTIDDRSAASYDRTATLDRIVPNRSIWRGSAALKPQVLEPPASKTVH